MTAEPLPREARLPLTDRLSPRHASYARILAAHEQALRNGTPGYVDPASGFFVFTAAELWARGTCCDSGCRHCPYASGPRGPEGLPPDA